MTKETGPEEGVQRTLDLKELVKDATWRDVLMGLVESSSIDPWDIDIGKIANEYVQTIKKMKVLDLHIPANMTLAASILLRMKSDSMVMFKEEIQEEVDGVAMQRQVPEVPELIPKFRLQPHKKVTLTELMDALDEAMRVSEERSMIDPEMEAPLDFVVVKEDIDQKIASAYKLVASNARANGTVEYSSLARLFSSERVAVSDLFIPLLFLAHRKELDISQEQFFGDIMISMRNGAKDAVDSGE
ncbi:MAG: segregation/condensation protein A [Candidatus Micrarchaeota archaeon]|nr:segregation/condensation protein A [Candidatus Micrarchaeota archaeon]